MIALEKWVINTPKPYCNKSSLFAPVERNKHMRKQNITNIIVRESITTALFQLIEKKNFSEITISELVKRAGVSRNSFYRNYDNLEDILRQFLRNTVETWWKSCPQKEYPDVYLHLFRMFLTIKREINIIYKAGLSHLMIDLFAYCNQEARAQATTPDALYKTTFFSTGLWGVSNEWILRGMKESPEEMYEIFGGQN